MLLAALFPFMCIFLRTIGLFVTAPVLGARFIPAQLKVALSLVMASFLWSYVKTSPVPTSTAGWIASAMGEVAFGLFVGMIASIVLSAVETAGHIADVELGFGLANVIDPELGSSAPLLGTLKYLLITVVFLALDGHHLFIRGLAESFSILPAGAARIPSAWADLATSAAGRMLLVSLVLSCPIWVSMLITDVALGVLARSVPQLNVFVVGIPVKALVGLAVLCASLGFYGVFTEELTGLLRNVLQNFMGALSR